MIPSAWRWYSSSLSGWRDKLLREAETSFYIKWHGCIWLCDTRTWSISHYNIITICKERLFYFHLHLNLIREPHTGGADITYKISVHSASVTVASEVNLIWMSAPVLRLVPEIVIRVPPSRGPCDGKMDSSCGFWKTKLCKISNNINLFKYVKKYWDKGHNIFTVVMLNSFKETSAIAKVEHIGYLNSQKTPHSLPWRQAMGCLLWAFW